MAPKRYSAPWAILPVAVALAAWLLFGGAAAAGDVSEADRLLAALREQMVTRQIRDRGITDGKILNAFRKVERHRFVPPDLVPYAYADRPLPIGLGQTISQPYIVAFMTEVLDLSPEDRVLEIGTGSGYQAAILAELCHRVFSIEILPALGNRAAKLLASLGYTNVKVKVGDGYQGWPQHAPFDAVIVTCAPTHVPVPLQEQLKDGGRMIIPVGPSYNQKLVYLRKTGDILKKEKVLSVRFVPMVDGDGKTY